MDAMIRFCIYALDAVSGSRRRILNTLRMAAGRENNRVLHGKITIRDPHANIKPLSLANEGVVTPR